MILLVITQTVDYKDDNLGFFHRWLEVFSSHVSELHVITAFLGMCNLPENVSVYSLGKEIHASRMKRYFRFYRYLFKVLPRADAIFVHMIPMWVLLVFPVAIFFRKNIYLWYTHKSVPLFLRLAEKIATCIFTASSESFRLSSKKVFILGHGIDKDHFRQSSTIKPNNFFRILSASRISNIKNIEKMVLTADYLRKIFPKDKKFELIIAGSPRTRDDEVYFHHIKNMVNKLNMDNIIKFIGSKSQDEMAKEYQQSNLFLSFSFTGSLDKSVLEAMSSGVNILTSNEAFFTLLPKENIIAADDDFRTTAQKIMYLMETEGERDVDTLRNIVSENHDLKNLIQKIIDELENLHH